MIGIISDIHGNYPALAAVIEELKKKNCTDIFCLGDIAGYYCMINECIELLRENNVISIKGNHDNYLIGEGICPRSNTANLCIQYQQKVINESNKMWLQANEIILLNETFCAVHGGWNDFLDEYVVNFNFEDKKVQQYKVNMFLSGHTHKPLVQRTGEKAYCNPGSVGQPRDHNPKASYAIIDGQDVMLYRIEYNIDEIAREMNKAGFDEYFYSNLYKGCRIGEVQAENTERNVDWRRR
ncbi:metallophosphoesterase family protein [Faecalicatena contorta]|uniref:Phosphoesterase n=1 Tax=Faecalicatena contorta TaxID=39482 RepID=A0A315ZRQ2_9FIRM|nr:YfcE family phosphodiesterase [Faecalicatena contorta]PWJ48221.1 putative phosphoesterase [Faecalicatena contorta]SUQ15497.1 phosphoesterase, MJ0936 family [Faecalicatena contorta]